MKKRKATEFKVWAVMHGYTAQKMSDDTGYSKSIIHQWLQGTRVPSRKSMARLQEIYGIDILKFWF